MAVALSTLPHEILTKIFDLLPVTEFTRLSSVCKDLHSFVEDEKLWRQRCYRDFNISLTQTFRTVGWKRLYKALNDPVVYTWGESSQGRLGRELEDYGSTPGIVEGMSGKGVTQIVCGGWSMTALTKKGEVWMWGTMNPETNPNLNPEDYDPEELSTVPPSYFRLTRSGPTAIHRAPVQIEGLMGKNVKSIASGRAHSLALTDQGEVYQWRSITRVQKIDVSDQARIIQIAAGWTHSLALAEDGTIFSWQSDKPDMVSSDTLPNANKDEKYVLIAGGEFFTIALTNYGNVYKSESGDSLANLSPFPGAVNRRYAHISAAFRHFAAFNNEGKVAVWDDTGNEEIYNELQHVNQVTFGDWHFGALTNDGKLYTWGQYSGGALGLGANYGEVKKPTLVEELENRYVFNIAFAGWHSAALVVPLGSDD
ncbi:RCC1/BLIP-II protein [Basidiobolus meristosporus CBS 931.73]|uniref:RCC1/BLIP-II protein n=1 Tax=Basidiobolus meristosporus CBS 931.73 TaxID=1314790 RepID=A0A1Y1XRS5_9FUNG|nr:RCC1/BLIP-II protein [Basidiobolus meristosporus CBS 931.73]|eukprot:ORX88365.1 RCC1/BLIP-II protein [Basidiobolus meristosporus CBS 931.73]